MKRFLWGCISFCIVLFTISCSTAITSCTNGIELPTNEALHTSVASENVYNNFLESLDGPVTRGVKEYKYPNYFGGCFTNDKGVCVFQIVSGQDMAEVQKDLEVRTQSNHFSIRECQYQYAELESILSDIKQKLFDSNFNATRENLKWNGCYLDSERNRVVVRLGECTDKYIARFKSVVSDSPVIIFIEGGKNECNISNLVI